MTVKTAGQKEGAGLLERATPGPWRSVGNARKDSNFGGYATLVHGPEVARVAKVYGGNADDRKVCEANAELVALAFDHALLLRALADGAATLTPGFDSAHGDKGWKLDIKDGPVTVLYADAAGCPALPTDEPVRAALRRVVGSNG